MEVELKSIPHILREVREDFKECLPVGPGPFLKKLTEKSSSTGERILTGTERTELDKKRDFEEKRLYLLDVLSSKPSTNTYTEFKEILKEQSPHLYVILIEAEKLVTKGKFMTTVYTINVSILLPSTLIAVLQNIDLIAVEWVTLLRGLFGMHPY